MNTLKTAVVVVVLLAVLYGVYRVLNMPDPPLSMDDLIDSEELVDPEVEIGTPLTDEPDGLQKLPLGLTDRSPANLGNPDLNSNTSLTGAPQRPEVGTPGSHSPHDGEFGKSTITQPDSESFADTRSPRDERQGTENLDPAPFDSVKKRDFNAPSLSGLERAWREARRLIDDGNFREALTELSLYYELPGLSDTQHQQLLDWLDPLAGKVIYSTEHHLEDAYIAQGESIEQIAQDHRVPWQLLYNINRKVIDDPQQLRSGTELKVIKGPFRSEVSLQNRKMTLFLRDMYAGRFDIDVGNDPVPVPNDYKVLDKKEWGDYANANGQQIPGSHKASPYGQWWIGLQNNVSIHGSARNGEGPPTGCINLNAADAKDVFEILSKGSPITILR